jgi:hypothetical protein
MSKRNSGSDLSASLPTSIPHTFPLFCFFYTKTPIFGMPFADPVSEWFVDGFFDA